MGHINRRSQHHDGARSQHFLRDARLARSLVARAGVRRGETVLEPGAGRGIITQALAEHGCRVIAVEKDPRLFRSLRARFIGRTNVECHLGDALAVPLPREPYSVVANVPFAISSALVRRLLDAANPPRVACLIVQREAAEKYAGTPRGTLFALEYAPLFELAIVQRVERADFRPPPSVDCVVLRIERREAPLVPPAALGRYRTFVRVAFGRHGPDVRRSLRAFFTPPQLRRLTRDLGFALESPAYELRTEHWIGLWRFFERARAIPPVRRGGEVICRGSPRLADPGLAAYVGSTSRRALRTSAATR